MALADPTLDTGRIEQMTGSPPRLADLEAATRRSPSDMHVWRSLADEYFRLGRTVEADAAYQRHILASVNDPRLHEAALALAANRLDVAERILKPHLKHYPTDVAAIRMLAELAGRIGRVGDAEKLLRRALELAPRFAPARLNLAFALNRQERFVEALEEVDRLLAEEPDNPAYINLKGVVFARVGDYADAVTQFEAVLRTRPNQPRIWLSFGHSLKTLGRQDACVAAYRQSIALQPTLGEAWWSLANLKAYRFSDEDMAAMDAALGEPRLSPDDRLHLHFALGTAHENRQDFKRSFGHYEQANHIRAQQLRYSPERIHAVVVDSIGKLDRDFFAARRNWGEVRPDPVFILGMPRSGSTLVEQILSSHPLVEGTRELPDIEMLARRMANSDGDYVDALLRAGPEELAALGASYLERTRVHRKHGTPYFIDKMPNNWTYLPFIHLILPNAKIIDTRRGAMACCFSNFKQHYARGQAFSYDMDHLARYFTDYTALMAHLDDVLPGKVHRVRHEDMVDDPEREIRALLTYLGLPFDPACLRFWETDRPVQTASSQQVRQPIYREGVDQWRGYAPFLEKLRTSLGSLADL
ncbi:MAG TPA: sulfotransferase [Sphingobium sp.]